MEFDRQFFVDHARMIQFDHGHQSLLKVDFRPCQPKRIRIGFGNIERFGKKLTKSIQHFDRCYDRVGLRFGR